MIGQSLRRGRKRASLLNSSMANKDPGPGFLIRDRFALAYARSLPVCFFSRQVKASFEPAVIKLAGTEWTLDLSPIGICDPGVIYSRRMIRDRRLSLVRFMASPGGQALILPLMLALSSQNKSVCTPPRARADVESRLELRHDGLLFPGRRAGRS